MAPKLIDLKRTEADKKKERASYEESPYLGESEDYSYGLSIRLDEDAITKLGIDTSAMGSESVVIVCAEGVVTEESSNTYNGKTRRSMTIQLRKVSVEPQGDEEDAAKILYGKD